MYCPQCKAEYQQGFTRCADCDVELVENYVEAARHPLAKKVTLSDKCEVRLWRGTDPHFYLELVRSLWNKKVACYAAPENPPLPDSLKGQHLSTSDPGGFEVWVSEEDVPLAKWILESLEEESEKEPDEEGTASGKATVDEVSPDVAGVCPLCFGEFATPSSYCPNCGVPLRLPQADIAPEDSARELCNLANPNFITELREALLASGIPFNNARILYGDFISGRKYGPNYEVLVLKKDFELATQAMSQVLQHWEFEPSAGFHVGRDSFLDYGLELAAQKGWFPEDISALVWSGENIGLVGGIGLALQEHEIPYRVETEQSRTARVFSHPENEGRARELVREVVEGVPPE
jgi:hypothetical protein